MTPDQDYRPNISATGDVTLTRKPDLAYVTLYIRAEGILLEDAVREAASKTEQVLRALREAYGSEIKDVQVKDLHAGEGKPSLGLGMARDRSNPPRPEVVTGLLVVLPAKQDLAVKVVDSACRMGCLMANPSGAFPAGHGTQNVILYGLSQPEEAEQEATALAVAEARDRVARIAKTLDKRIGAVRHIGAMVFHMPDDFSRRRRTPLLSGESYLSASADQVEVPARVSVAFELLD
jgi:uncharacterized protein YggE